MKSIRIYIATILVPDPGSLSNNANKVKAAELKATVKKKAGSGTEKDVTIRSTCTKVVCDRLAYEK